MELNSIFSTYGASSIYSTSSTSAAAALTETATTDTTSTANTDTVSFSVSSVVSSHQQSGQSLIEMSNDDFRDHLSDLVAAMEAEGYDVSNFADIESMSDEDLEALKTEMHEAAGGRKAGPPPPPPGYSADSVVASDSQDSLTQILLDALTQSEDDEEAAIISDLSSSLLDALQADLTLDESGDLASFVAANM